MTLAVNTNWTDDKNTGFWFRSNLACQICGKPRCERSRDGYSIKCWRTVNPATGALPLVVRLTEPFKVTAEDMARAEGRKLSIPKGAPEVIDKAILALLTALPVEDADAEAFSARNPDFDGRTEAAREWLTRHRYGSLTGDRAKLLSAIGAAMASVNGVTDGMTVPPLASLFTAARSGSLPPPGLLIPVLDRNGLIINLRLRVREKDDVGRYRWFKGAGVDLHVAMPVGNRVKWDRIWITEGEIKADIACEILGEPVISLPGVTAYHSEAIALAKRMVGEGTVVVAVDSDSATNAQVTSAVRSLGRNLVASGIQTSFALWGTEQKGLDDLLTTGGKPEIVSGREYFDRIANTRIDPSKTQTINTELKQLPNTTGFSGINRKATMAVHSVWKERGGSAKFLRASLCGLWTIREDCSRCLKHEGERRVFAENVVCPHCADLRAITQSASIRALWPERVATASLRHEHASPDEQKSRWKDWKKKILKASRQLKVDGKAVLSRCRWVAGIKSSMVVSSNNEDAKVFSAAGLIACIENRIKISHEVARVCRERSDHVSKQLAVVEQDAFSATSIDKFLEDPWLSRFVSTSAGRTAKKELQWLSASGLREWRASHRDAEAKARGEAPRDPSLSSCCKVAKVCSLHDEDGKLRYSKLGPFRSNDIDQAMQGEVLVVFRPERVAAAAERDRQAAQRPPA